MNKFGSFFFSKLLGKDISNITGSIIGKLNDLILDFESERPTVKAIEVKNGMRRSYISSESMEVNNDRNERYSIKINNSSISVAPISEKDIFLARDFLDKQIVDINGKRVKRVNDVRIGIVNDAWMVIAVDIGFRGILRRLSLEYIAIRLTQLLNIEFRNKLIIWNKVQPLTTGTDNLRLSTSISKIKTLHTADIADIIEELDNQSRNALFQSFDDEKAAEVLEEVDTEVQKSLLDTLSDEKASDLLEIMPSDEAADILEEIEYTRAERLLTQMEAENSDEIRELMEYEEKTIGSIMSKDYTAFLPDITVGEAFIHFKKNRLKEDVGHYIYIVNSKNQLLGLLSSVDMIESEPDTKLYDIMTPRINTLKDEDKIDKAMEIMQKYNLISIPIVNEERELIGITSLNDLVYEYIRLRRVVV